MGTLLCQAHGWQPMQTMSIHTVWNKGTQGDSDTELHGLLCLHRDRKTQTVGKKLGYMGIYKYTLYAIAHGDKSRSKAYNVTYPEIWLGWY